MQRAECRVIEINGLGTEYYQLILERPQELSFAPGQFVHVIDRNSPDLLRRPFSIASQEEHAFSLVIKEVGSMSRRLRGMDRGDVLDLLGPLGKPFELSSSRRAVLVGGGVGIAPLLRLSQVLREEGRENLCLLGFRDEYEPAQLFSPEHLLIHRESVSGGLVTDLLRENLRMSDEVFACGPEPMLRAVRRISLEAGVPVQLSLEERMACGIGACIGCAVKTVSPQGHIYKKVCTDGPVFRGEELPW